MNRFKNGDRVVALSNCPTNSLQTFYKGKLYTVKGTKFCSHCGEQTINLGQNTEDKDAICYSCKGILTTGGLGWSSSKFFVKLDDLDKALERAVEEEDYELAALLRDLQLQETC